MASTAAGYRTKFKITADVVNSDGDQDLNRARTRQGRKKTNRSRRKEKISESENLAKSSADASRFFMKIRGPQALPNRPQKRWPAPPLNLLSSYFLDTTLAS